MPVSSSAGKGEQVPEKLRRILLALLAGVLLLGTACGGGDDGESDAGGDTSATEEGDDTSETPEDSVDATEDSDDEEGEDEEGEEDTGDDGTSYTAVDFSFDGPTTLPAGQTQVTLTNEGEEPHEFVLMQLDDNKSVDDILAEVKKGAKGPPPPWVEFVGGMRPVKPGKTGKATLEVEAGGNYVIACFIPSKKQNNQPHALLGMITPLTVE